MGDDMGLKSHTPGGRGAAHQGVLGTLESRYQPPCESAPNEKPATRTGLHVFGRSASGLACGRTQNSRGARHLSSAPLSSQGAHFDLFLPVAEPQADGGLVLP